MAERIVSPGVFTQERDQSFLAEGVAQIGAAFIGPTTMGPAFIPTQVIGVDGFVRTFGEPDTTSYLGYAVKNYLQQAGSATVVRVLGKGGYSQNGMAIYASGSTGKKIYALLHPTIEGANGGVTNGFTSFKLLAGAPVSGSPNLPGSTSSFSLEVVGVTTTSGSGLSTNVSSTSYLGTFLGYDAQSPTSASAYTYAIFPDALNQVGGNVFLDSGSVSLGFATDYANALTPWIQSQPIGGAAQDLFRVHTLADGTNANTMYKISITGIAPSVDPDSNYGTFSVLVRDFNDTDSAVNVLEQFDNLTLDPDSPNYIALRIGNSRPITDMTTNETYYDGEYPNRSKFIRVEMSPDTIPETAVPWGFAKLAGIVSASASQFSSGSYVTSRWMSASVSGYNPEASEDKRKFYGFNFSATQNPTGLSYLAPIYNRFDESNQVTFGTAFTLEGLNEIKTDTGPGSRSIALTSGSDIGYRRFTVPFQGGFDALNPARRINMGDKIVPSNTLGFNLSSATSSGSVAYKQALDSISNPDNIDLNLLVLPGVIYSQHQYIAQSAIDLCETRGDCFYIMDLVGLTQTVGEAVSTAEPLDTNYAASYYPWVRVSDESTGKLMWAPPSVVLPEVYAYSDSVGAEWFAPAGLNRGGIPGAVGVKTRLSQTLRDELYEGKVNPIAQFPQQGISVWGQKTLQRRASALDRVNVRRLLITVKKFIASSARYLVFEQNTEATRNRFLNIVNPYLSGIQQRSGLTAFRVVMDDSNNTPDVIDRNILVGSIYLQPTRTAEFIKLDFNILPTGATFDTI
jgi:hypothetical protein